MKCKITKWIPNEQRLKPFVIEGDGHTIIKEVIKSVELYPFLNCKIEWSDFPEVEE